MGEEQKQVGLHILHTVAVDAIGLPQQMNRKIAVAIWLRHQRGASLQEAIDRAKVPSTDCVVESDLTLQIECVQMSTRKPEQVPHNLCCAELASDVQRKCLLIDGNL